MRFRHPDGSTVHLAHCATVRPVEDLDGLLAVLDEVAPVRRELDVPVLGVGLWLGHSLAAELAGTPAALDRLRAALARNGLEVVSLTGSPSAGVAGMTGTRVYRPDWTQPERLRYTLDLIDVLAAVLPADAAYGSVSTLPLAWRFPWSRKRDKAARRAIGRVEERLGRVEADTGRPIRIALEPEPGCVLEMVPQATYWLAPYAGPARIGLCLDTCHLAVQFEDPESTFALLGATGVEIVKSQLAAAVQVPYPDDLGTRRLLATLADPDTLHQVREWGGPGVDDLDRIEDLSGHAAWRVQFHVPAHLTLQPPLASTTEVVADCLTRLVGGPRPLTHHLESEIDTWSLRPGDRPGPGVDGVVAELTWVRDRLLGLGLTPVR